MGPNLMSRKDRNPVIEIARRTVAEQLDRAEHRDALGDLPPGDERRVHRPPGDPRDWPELAEIQRLVSERARD
jgi:hypothetical protein